MRSLADGKLKFTILTTAPAAGAANPTVTELNAGIDASPRVLTSDFNWTNAESATFDEKPLSQKGQAQTLGMSMYTLAATVFREYDPAGGTSVEDDVVYQALKVKGTTVWCYARESDKDATEPWAAEDECYLGGEVQTDKPARVGNEGSIKRRVIFLPQEMHDEVTVGAAAP